MVQPPTQRLKLETVNALGASFTTEDNFDVLNSLLFLEDNRIVYPIGHHITLRAPRLYTESHVVWHH